MDGQFVYSRGQKLCGFMVIKEIVNIRKEFDSQRIGLAQQHGRWFIVFEHQFGPVTSSK